MITVELRDNSVDNVALAVIREIAMATISEVSALLPGLSDDIVLGVGPGDQVIPETGEVGASVEPGRIEWSADPSRPGGIEGVARRQLRPRLFHELHHQARGWVIRGGARPTSFIEAPVCEGLATAFERDAAGRRPPWAEYPIEVDHWVEELMALPMTADYAEWNVPPSRRATLDRLPSRYLHCRPSHGGLRTVRRRVGDNPHRSSSRVGWVRLGRALIRPPGRGA